MTGVCKPTVLMYRSHGAAPCQPQAWPGHIQLAWRPRRCVFWAYSTEARCTCPSWSASVAIVLLSCTAVAPHSLRASGRYKHNTDVAIILAAVNESVTPACLDVDDPQT